MSDWKENNFDIQFPLPNPFRNEDSSFCSGSRQIDNSVIDIYYPIEDIEPTE